LLDDVAQDAPLGIDLGGHHDLGLGGAGGKAEGNGCTEQQGGQTHLFLLVYAGAPGAARQSAWARGGRRSCRRGEKAVPATVGWAVGSNLKRSAASVKARLSDPVSRMFLRVAAVASGAPLARGGVWTLVSGRRKGAPNARR